jgi:hypothetical protein
MPVMSKKLTKDEGKLTAGQAYLRGFLFVAAFIGAVVATRVVNDVYTHYFKKKTVEEYPKPTPWPLM